jgi:hypothetical protein
MNKSMKILFATFLILVSPLLFGQHLTGDAQRLSRLQGELTRLETTLSEQQLLSSQLARKAAESAAINNRAAENLKNNSSDRQSAKSARKSARHAQKDAANASKADARVLVLQNQVQQIKSQIAALKPYQAVDPKQPAGPRAVPADSTNTTARPFTGSVAEKVVEATYKAYPQQPGQPSIIINNIITPPAYPQHPGASPVSENQAIPEPSNGSKKIGDQSRAGVTGPALAPLPNSFGLKPSIRSGVWIVPVAGLHASNFRADFKDSKATGRTGWNAGLDFRIHIRRFFIQPGVHYLNSSLDLTSKDSLAQAPVLSGPRMQSLKVPLMMGVYLTRAQHAFFKINVKGGVSGNYLLAAERNQHKQFSRDNLQTCSYGLLAGIGLEFGIIALDLSHQWGMTKVFKDNNTKNNILTLTLGLRL